MMKNYDMKKTKEQLSVSVYINLEIKIYNHN